MFRPGTRQLVQRPLRRAALLAAALVVLWVATQFLSAPGPLPDPPSDNTTASERIAEARRTRGGIRPGYVAAFLLLAGGAAFAVYLRRRNGSSVVHRDVLQPVGKLQLGPGQQVHLVACGDEVLVIGTTSSQVTLLKTLSAAAIEAAPADISAPEAFAAPVTVPAGRTYRHEKLVETHAGAPPDPASATQGTHAGFADVLRRLGIAGVGTGSAHLS